VTPVFTSVSLHNGLLVFCALVLVAGSTNLCIRIELGGDRIKNIVFGNRRLLALEG